MLNLKQIFMIQFSSIIKWEPQLSRDSNDAAIIAIDVCTAFLRPITSFDIFD